MSSTAPGVDVSLHARDRWLRRVDPNDELPEDSILRAYNEADELRTSRQSRVHRDRGLVFIADNRDGRTTVITILTRGGRR